MIEKKTEERKTETEKNNMTKVIVYYNVRKMCEKKSFRNKRYTFVAKSFFETSIYLRLSIAYTVNPVGFKKKIIFLQKVGI